MNWEALGALSEFFGSIIVVVTIFFLAQQIRQANKLGTAAAEQEWFDGWNDIVRHLAIDVETGELMQTGFNDYSALTAPQKAVFMTKLVGIFNQAELALRLKRKGLLDTALTEKVMDICVSILMTDGGSEWWKDVGPSFGIYESIEKFRKRSDRSFRAWNSFSPWKLDNV
ncbi:MAG: hypothetical protein ACU84Q_20610 [Gammaproteobacteria bacterium]